MDPLSHYMFSWLLGKKLKFDSEKMRIVTLFAVLPDADAVAILLGYTFYWSFHATYTHILLIMVPLTVFISYVISFKTRKFYWKPALLGFFSHIFLDLFNPPLDLEKPSGRFLYPFSTQKIDLTLLGFSSEILSIFQILIFLFFLSIFLLKIVQRDYPWKPWIK